MRLEAWIPLVAVGGFAESSDFRSVQRDISAGIGAVKWPPGAPRFELNPTPKGNGVKPIKGGFIDALVARSWRTEVHTFDVFYEFANGRLPFVVEWETGNISSSHRAINRIANGILRDRISGGVLVVPSGEMYKYLTDRVGNARELEPYHQLWSHWADVPLNAEAYLAIIVVEHDALNLTAPLIRKGTDGRALI